MKLCCVLRALGLMACSAVLLLESCTAASSGVRAAPSQLAPSGFPAPAPTAVLVPELLRSPVGLAWDGAHFLVSDSGTPQISPQISKLDPRSGLAVERITWPGDNLGAIASDGTSVWGVDEGLRQILRLDLATGKVTRALDIPPAALHRPPAITGLASDGRALWLISACGLCSTLYRMDPTTGAVTQRLYPMCAPRGLAFDGAYLWTVASNGPNWPPRLSRRRIGGKTPEVVSSHRLLDFVAVGGGPFPRDPAAITAVGATLWVLDRATRRIFEVAADRSDGPHVTPLVKAVP